MYTVILANDHEPTQVNEEFVIDFFTRPAPDLLHPPVQRGIRSDFKTRHGGVYVWYADALLSDHSSVRIPREGSWDLVNRFIVYVGESHKRPLHKRLKAESRFRADQSQPQMGFGCLLADSLGIELRRVHPTKARFVDFKHQKIKLFDWMQSHVRFAFLEMPDADQIIRVQNILIDRLRPLFNLRRMRDDDHPFETDYRRILRDVRSRARTLPSL